MKQFVLLFSLVVLFVNLLGCKTAVSASSEKVQDPQMAAAGYLEMKSLKGFVIEDASYSSAESSDPVFYMLLKKETPWRDVVKSLQKELPEAKVTPSKRSSFTTVIAKNGDLVLMMTVGAAPKESQILSTAKLQVDNSPYCGILLSIRKVD